MVERTLWERKVASSSLAVPTFTALSDELITKSLEMTMPANNRSVRRSRNMLSRTGRYGGPRARDYISRVSRFAGSALLKPHTHFVRIW